MAEVDGTGLLDADAGRDVKLKSFTPDELLTCDVCSRANAPTRAACMYCGAPLTSKTTISSPETEAEPQTATVSTACYVVVPPELLSEINDILLRSQILTGLSVRMYLVSLTRSRRLVRLISQLSLTPW